MKTLASTLIVSLALIGGAAQAAGRSTPGDSDNTPFQGVYGQTQQDNGSETRAKVQADLEQSKAAGKSTLSEKDNAVFKPVKVSEGGGDETRTQLA